jgi:hypothetical protein
MTAVASAPAVAAPAVAAPANPGDTVTAANAPAGTAPAATTPAAKRTRAPAGASVFVADTRDAAMALAKQKGDKFTAFTVKVAGKPDRFLASNHRNSVANWLLTTDGYAITAGDGTNKGGRKPANPQATAERALEAMDDETRRALFAKYLGTGNVAAAAALPGAAAPRTDTSPEFDAAKTPAPSGAPAASAPVVGNQPAAKGGNAANKRK